MKYLGFERRKGRLGGEGERVFAEMTDAAELDPIPVGTERGATRRMSAVVAEEVAMLIEDIGGELSATDGQAFGHSADFAAQKFGERELFAAS